MTALEIPVHDSWGLRAAVVESGREIASPNGIRDLHTAGLLDSITPTNYHPRLPHDALTAPDSDDLRAPGRRQVDPHRAQPTGPAPSC